VAAITQPSDVPKYKPRVEIEWIVREVPGQLEALLTLLFDAPATASQNDKGRPPLAGPCKA